MTDDWVLELTQFTRSFPPDFAFGDYQEAIGQHSCIFFPEPIEHKGMGVSYSSYQLVMILA